MKIQGAVEQASLEQESVPVEFQNSVDIPFPSIVTGRKQSNILDASNDKG